MPTKKLAITIAGAVSLGSYEAGAMYEILEAIRQHNDNELTRKKGDFVHVDVITGASAGGMTGAILAQRLLYQKDDFVGPYDNPLYQTWVAQISMEELTAVIDKPIDQGGDRPAKLSLLSSARIERIAQAALCKCDDAGEIPLRGGAHNAIDPEHGIRLGLALTNLNGIDYGFPMFGGSRFEYTEFSDQMLRQFSPGDRSAEPWTEISAAAVACGAFPFAFRTKDLVRNFEDYDPEHTPNLEKWPEDAQTWPFTYTDGGVLQNQPLGMAKNLVDLNDNHQYQDNRFYLFVSPSPMSGMRNLALGESTTDLVRLAGRLIEVYMGQSVFRDWIKIKAINAQVELLDSRIRALAAAIRKDRLSDEALMATSRAMARIPSGRARPRARRTQALNRLATQYADELQSVGGRGTSKGEAVLNAALALEEAAGIGAYDSMRVYGLVTDSNQLAGAGIWAFVGFMDRRFRDHDYDRGRMVAQALLTNPDFQKRGELGPLRYTPPPIRKIDPDLDGLHLNKISPDDVTTLKDGLKRRVGQIIDELEPHWWQWLKKEILLKGADGLLDLLIEWEFSRDVQGASGEPRSTGGQRPTKSVSRSFKE